MQRVGGELDRVATLGPEPAERGGDRVGTDRARLEHGGSLGQLGGRGGGGARGGAALGLEADPRRSASASSASETRIRSPHDSAAGGAVEAAGERLAAAARRRSGSARRASAVHDRQSVRAVGRPEAYSG